MKIRDYVNGIKTKEQAIILMGNLLCGNITVDVNTGEMTEETEKEQPFGRELADVLKLLAVKVVPVEVLYRFGTRDVDIVFDETRIDEITSEMNEDEQTFGLIASLLDGCTQIQNGTDLILYCYGQAPQSYDTIKAVTTVTDINEILEDYKQYWEDCEDDTLLLVHKLLTILWS